MRFQDGASLDADAVVGNLEHLRRERAFPGRAERVGPHLVQITLDRPNAALLSTLSQPFFAMQSPRRLAGPGSEQPVGTGPFRLDAARPGRVELSAFDGHWAGAPRLRRLVFRRFADEEALAQALVSGEADVSSAIGPDPGGPAARRARAHPRLADRPQPHLPRRQQRARARSPTRACAGRSPAPSTGRASCARSSEGHAEPAHTALPPTLFGHDTRARELVLDRDAARRLLAAARVPEGFETTLTVSRAPRPYLLEPLRVAARLRDDLARVGVVRAPARGGDLDRARGPHLARGLRPRAARLAGRHPRPERLPDRAARLGLHRHHEPHPLPQPGHGRPAEARPHGQRARCTRLALYREAQELFQKDMPFVPLYHSSVFTAHRRDVRGVVIGPTGILRFDKAWKQP